MSVGEVDAYLAGVADPGRTTLERLRTTILHTVPEAEQGLAYGAPAFKLSGKTIAGFAAFKHHLSYLPHSGDVIAEVGDDLAGYPTSKGAVKFALDQPLPEQLVKKLIGARMRELGLAR